MSHHCAAVLQTADGGWEVIFYIGSIFTSYQEAYGVHGLWLFKPIKLRKRMELIPR